MGSARIPTRRGHTAARARPARGACAWCSTTPAASCWREGWERRWSSGRSYGSASVWLRALGALHRKGIIHKDLTPGHVIIDEATGHVRLTGLGIASRLRRERQTPEPPEVIAGTLPYMAPEQTGRMNRSIDSRSDLYALGVILYEMLTGALPFTASDPMEWVHRHIARQPLAPTERVQRVPRALSAIIMRLLAKTAEQRYQTAAGVERDSRRCLTQWQAEHRIDDFPVGRQDTPDQLSIPERLHGREREVQASPGRVRSGRQGRHAGVGPRVRLLRHRQIVGRQRIAQGTVPARGWFASAFDQGKRNMPHATLAQAFQNLVLGLLVKSESALAVWREAFEAALARMDSW